MAAATVAPVEPITIPTGSGAREVVDVGATALNLQKVENPQVSLDQCASRYGATAVRSIFARLEEMDEISKFEEVNLSDNNIGDEGAHWLAQGLNGTTKSGEQVGKNLKKLIMPRARMGAEGMKAMGAILGGSASLENVILSSNICDAEGVEGEFSAGLAANKSVRSLCLAACRLGDRGAIALEAPLKAHPALEHVSLQYNRLEVAAAKSLANMLAMNQALRYLDLTGNSFGTDGALALVEGVKKNKGRLQRLSVSTCEIQHAGVQAFCKLFVAPEGKALTYLDLRNNNVPYRAMVQLRRELGRPMDGEDAEGWMLVFGARQLLLNN